jgi:hypothetical protein
MVTLKAGVLVLRILASWHDDNLHVLGSVKPTHSQSPVAHESVTHVACRLDGALPCPISRALGMLHVIFFFFFLHRIVRQMAMSLLVSFWFDKQDKRPGTGSFSLTCVLIQLSDLRQFGIRSEGFLFPWSGTEDRFGKPAGSNCALLVVRIVF